MKTLLVSLISCTLFFLSSCTKDRAVGPAQPDLKSGFPEEISIIINNKCSTTGCHTSQSKAAAGGLAMETWDQLFEGGNGGAVVIPFRPDQSWLMFYTNTDTSKGVILTPTMPFNKPPLSDAEWQTLFDWVAAGAPNSAGEVPFSGNPDREKFYVSNQGCDLVTVFDAESRLAMRYIDAGESSGIEVPHQIRVSPDGKYWYVIFVNGTTIEKYSAETDSRIGSVDIGTGFWNTMTITDDGKYAYAINFDSESSVVRADLDNMVVTNTYKSLSDFVNLHGSWVNKAGTTLYVTAQYGNHILKFDVSEPDFVTFESVILDELLSPNFNQGKIDPHEVALSPDETKYFITCQSSNDVRVFDTSSDTIIAIIPVGVYPLELAFSETHPYLFVTCQEDPCGDPKCKGSVYVIDYNTMQVVKVLQEGLYQPHGIAVMDGEGYAIVSSRNIDVAGPAPHHQSGCSGRNGFLKLIELSTLEFIPGYRTEVSVDPYSVAGR